MPWNGIRLDTNIHISSAGWIPFSVLCQLTAPRDVERILQSNRFKGSKGTLCTEVSAGNFTAFWIHKGARTSLHGTRKEVTLFFMHGGAYCFGHALADIPLFLRLVEMSETQGICLNVFSLSYSLAPGAAFPCQQNEAVSGYRYLLEVEHVDPESIIICGESAGGHLALSTLIGLEEAGLPKPGAALLLAPWVDLENKAASITRNRNRDFLQKRQLDLCAQAVIGPDGYRQCPQLVDYAQPCGSRRSWKELLPKHTWINVGSHDLFVDGIIAFKEHAVADGASISLELTPNQPHGWYLLADRPTMAIYCNMDSDAQVQAGMLPGAECIASGLFTLLRELGRLNDT